MKDRLGRLRLLLAIALVAAVGLKGGVPSIVADWRSHVGRQEPDLVSREVERYPPLIPWLPGRGTVGYLPEEQQTSEAFLRFTLAQYVLTPRIVVTGTGPDFVIAGPEALLFDDDRRGAASRDPRLRGYILYQRLPNGMRVFRRFE